MKISLGSWAFSFGPYADNPVPFDTTVKRLAEAGYDGVEVCGFPPHVTLEEYPDAVSRRGVADLVGSHGLAISGYAADFSMVNPVVRANRTRYLDLFSENLELCADIGSPAIRVDTVAAPGSVSSREFPNALDRMADLWRECADLAHKAGVRMVWEFEPGFLFNKPNDIVLLHQLVGHPNFGVIFDTCHAYMCAVAGARQDGAKETLSGGVNAFLDKLKGMIGAVHLIDSDGTLHADETSTHRPFGEGLIDFEDLAPRLLAVPNIDWWTVDMCFWEGSWELVETSREYVARLLKQNVLAS